MTIAITGSSGFIGAELAGHFLRKGHRVLMMQRSVPVDIPAGAAHVPFDLRNPDILFPERPDVLVHCAFMAFSPSQPDAEEVNIQSTLALRDLCRANGIHFIFLSTMSAHGDAMSVYGRHKHRLEQMMDAGRETVLKLGLVVGASGGLFSRISDTVAGSVPVPLVDGGAQPIQTVGVDEVCQAVETVIDRKVTGLLLVGSEEVHTLRTLYEVIAGAKGRKPRFISLPYALFDLALTVLALLPLKLPVSKENLIGLKCLRAFDTAPDLQRIGMELRPLKQTVEKYSRP